MNNKQFYEQFWAGHSTPLGTQLAIHQESRRPLLKLLTKHLPLEKGARFLEVGCGTALDACLLARIRPEAAAFALDLSQHAVTLARQNASALQLLVRAMVADLTTLPFAAESFDLVFSQGVLEHFEDPLPAVAEQARVLRAGGVLVIDVPQKYSLYTLQKRRAMRENRWPWGWETEYSVGDLRAWGRKLGLEPCGAIGHQHGRIVDRLLVHPHRMIRNKLARHNGNGSGNGYQPGPLARAWEAGWDWVDERVGPYLAINVAVAFRKPARA